MKSAVYLEPQVDAHLSAAAGAVMSDRRYIRVFADAAYLASYAPFSPVFAIPPTWSDYRVGRYEWDVGPGTGAYQVICFELDQ